VTDDPRWPRASAWLSTEAPGGPVDVTVLGVPASRTSISATHAHLPPTAIREALARYSTYSWGHDVDIADLAAWAAGDVLDPDGPDGEARVIERVAGIVPSTRLLIALGGDNSITHSVARGVWGEAIGAAGLITLECAPRPARRGEQRIAGPPAGRGRARRAPGRAEIGRAACRGRWEEPVAGERIHTTHTSRFENGQRA